MIRQDSGAGGSDLDSDSDWYTVSLTLAPGVPKMVSSLPANATRDQARDWLTSIVREVGPGFHIDTPFEEYLNDFGPTYSSTRAAMLNESLGRVLMVLGHEEPYDLALAEIRSMLAL